MVPIFLCDQIILDDLNLMLLKQVYPNYKHNFRLMKEEDQKILYHVYISHSKLIYFNLDSIDN